MRASQDFEYLSSTAMMFPSIQRRWRACLCGEAGEALTLAHLRHRDAQRASIFTAQNCSHWIIGEHATVSPLWLSFHILLLIPLFLFSSKTKTWWLFTEQIEILRVRAHFIKAIVHILRRRCVCTFFDIIMRMQTRRPDSKHELTVLTFIFLSASCIPAWRTQTQKAYTDCACIINMAAEWLKWFLTSACNGLHTTF